MKKKIAILCALLSINSFVGANGYPAQQGSQASEHGHGHHGHHHHHSDKIADEADQNRLKVLAEEDDAANVYTHFSRAGLLLGTVMTGVGIKYNIPKATQAGIAIFGTSAAGGGLIYYAGQGRAQERKEILDRRAKNNHH